MLQQATSKLSAFQCGVTINYYWRELVKGRLEVSEKLTEILKEIISEDKTGEDWLLTESCDMFQFPSFCGGYDATEQYFLFSYYGDNEKEWWFEIVLKVVPLILRSELLFIELFEPR